MTKRIFFTFPSEKSKKKALKAEIKKEKEFLWHFLGEKKEEKNGTNIYYGLRKDRLQKRRK